MKPNDDTNERRGGAGRGQGRKPKPAHVRRDQRIMVRVTVDELAELQAAADEAGVTVAELVHTRAFLIR